MLNTHKGVDIAKAKIPRKHIILSQDSKAGDFDMILQYVNRESQYSAKAKFHALKQNMESASVMRI
jgi:hypothetical protein